MLIRAACSLLAVLCLAPSAPAGDAREAGLARGLDAVESLLERDERDKALLLIGWLVEEHPRSLKAHLLYQDLRLTMGERTALVSLYGRRATREGATADDAFLHARLLVGRRKETALKRTLKLDPRHFRALLALGSYHVEEGKMREAREILERACAEEPGSALPVNLLGWAAETAGRTEEAAKLYRAAMEIDSSFALPRTNLGMLLLGADRRTEAVDLLTEARDLDPADPIPLLGLGMAEIAAGEIEAARDLFREAVELDSNTRASLGLLAQAYLSLGEHDLAEDALTRALALEPGDVSVLLSLGYLEIERGNMKSALVWVDRALSFDDRSPEAHHLRGLCLELNGDLPAAEKAYLGAMRLEPERSDHAHALGALYSNLGRWKDAIQAYTKAASLAGHTVETLLDLAFAYVGSGDARRAATCFTEVLDRDPDNLEAWMNLGLLYQEKLRDKVRAARAYEEYLSRGGTDVRVQVWLEEVKGR